MIQSERFILKICHRLSHARLLEGYTDGDIAALFMVGIPSNMYSARTVPYSICVLLELGWFDSRWHLSLFLLQVFVTGVPFGISKLHGA